MYSNCFGGGRAYVPAIVLAAQRNDLEIMEVLLQHGANPNAANSGRPALHMAGIFNNLTGMRMLLDAGAKVDAVDSQGDTALNSAAYSGKGRLVEMLLEHGADPNRRGFLKFTPLARAAGCNAGMESRRVGSTISPCSEAAFILIKHGADPKIRNFQGWSPAGLLEDESRRKGMMQALRGALPAPPQYPSTDLIDAAHAGGVSEMRRVLQTSVNINAVAYDGESALSAAMTYGQKSYYLDGHSSNGSRKLMQTRLDKQMAAVQQRRTQMVGLLLAQKTRLKISGGKAAKSVFGAVVMRDSNTLEQLLANGADPNAYAPGGVTALMFAANADDADCVDVLLRHGADPRKRDNLRRTANSYMPPAELRALPTPVSALLDGVTSKNGAFYR